MHPLQVPVAKRPSFYGWENSNADGYTIKEQVSGTKKPLKVIAVGAGACGIAFLKIQQDHLENVEVVVYDKNDDVSGTWVENRYPGCACDIPSVTYQYTFEPKVWTKFYSEASEIFSYFEGVVKKYDLAKYIKLRHLVENAEWDDQRAKWIVTIHDLSTDTSFEDDCDVLINSGGILNFWQWPDIKDLREFRGILTHSATWPEDLDLSGKRVAVVGTGSSGIQLITSLQPKAAQLYTWVRTPTWITAGYASNHAGKGGQNFEYSEEQKRRFAEDPVYYLKYRKMIESEMSDFFLVHKNTPTSNAFQEIAKAEMEEKLAKNKELREVLIPKYFPVGCKRPTPGNGYLEALTAENVKVFPNTGLTQVTANGFLDPDGNEVEVDAIVLATGFNTTWIPRFPIRAHGHNLQDVYQKRSLSYFGVAAKHMPNYFTFYGPYGPLGQGSVLPMAECYAKYIVQAIEKIQIENIRSMTPKSNVIEAYGDHADVWNKRMVWDAPCRSWMKGGQLDGKVLVYCGTRAQIMELLEKPRYEDYDITYWGKNMWAWLGNGFTQRDVDGRDITWFLGLVDGIDQQRDYVI
ncbi:FAD/NAD-P-binding domain-containing protein [Penicillium sp. IBT 35674x]|nr:FAD/NAD-P-binding domain-containing protein [Penicillium sp. IBT 35674x]